MQGIYYNCVFSILGFVHIKFWSCTCHDAGAAVVVLHLLFLVKLLLHLCINVEC
jgi:hypothetical protein